MTWQSQIMFGWASSSALVVSSDLLPLQVYLSFLYRQLVSICTSVCAVHVCWQVCRSIMDLSIISKHFSKRKTSWFPCFIFSVLLPAWVLSSLKLDIFILLDLLFFKEFLSPSLSYKSLLVETTHKKNYKIWLKTEHKM